MAGRLCYIVVKNGFIIHETYRRGHTESSLHPGFSTTKSLCAGLFGVAVQQGWASPDMLVREHNEGTRLCNADASLRNVLTMTGQSPDLSEPTFIYDASGLACLDALKDFIEQNNPEGLSSLEWKDKYFEEALGFEHSAWGDPASGEIRCGSTVQASCRDLARAGQLWANDGYWPGHGQLMDEDYAREGRGWVFPSAMPPYGFTTWLNPIDPVAPDVFTYGGANSQCVHISPELRAVVVSMGDGDNSDCHGDLDPSVTPWSVVRDALDTRRRRRRSPPAGRPSRPNSTANSSTPFAR